LYTVAIVKNDNQSVC